MEKTRVWQSAIFLFSVLLATSSCFAAGTYTFSWSPNPEPVEGYWLYWRIPPATTYSKTASTSIDTGKPATVGESVLYTFDASGLVVNQTYCFALTAYNGLDESAHTSNDVCVQTPAGDGTTIINMMRRTVD